MRLGVAHTIFLEWRTRYLLESPIHRIDRFELVSRRFAPKSLLKAPVRTTVRIGVTGSPVRATMNPLCNQIDNADTENWSQAHAHPMVNFSI